MELVWDIYYAVLKDGSLIVDQYIRNDSLELCTVGVPV